MCCPSVCKSEILFLWLPAAPGRRRRWGEEPRGVGHRGLGRYCSSSHVGLNREEEERLTRECGKFREGKRHTEGVERRGDEQRHVQAPGPILGVKGNSHFGCSCLGGGREQFPLLVETSEPGLITEVSPGFRMAVKDSSRREGSSPNHSHREEEHKRNPGTCRNRIFSRPKQNKTKTKQTTTKSRTPDSSSIVTESGRKTCQPD